MTGGGGGGEISEIISEGLCESMWKIMCESKCEILQ